MVGVRTTKYTVSGKRNRKVKKEITYSIYIHTMYIPLCCMLGICVICGIQNLFFDNKMA